MRLFIGISIGDEARAALARAAAQMRRIAAGRYVRDDMYHVTLAFLGELEVGRIDDIKAAMDEASGHARAVSLALSSADTFGRGESAILYAGVRRGGTGGCLGRSQARAGCAAIALRSQAVQGAHHARVARERDEGTAQHPDRAGPLPGKRADALSQLPGEWRFAVFADLHVALSGG